MCSRPATGRVDLADALGQLAALGAAVVVCEGGPSLNGQLVAAGLVDELCLTLAPLVDRRRLGPHRGRPRRRARARCGSPHLLEEDGALFLRYVRT